MTSTSCITGTGFMKCMPITCVGPPGARGDLGDRDRAGVGREDRVRRRRRGRAARRSELDRRVLARRLDDERRRPPRASSAVRGRDPAEHRGRRVGRRACPSSPGARGSPRSSRSPSPARRGALSTSATVPAVLREDVGDAVAHRAGADDGGSAHVGSFPAQRRATRTAMVSASVAARPPSGPNAPAGEPGRVARRRSRARECGTAGRSPARRARRASRSSRGARPYAVQMPPGA